jgi:hypothetical protein
MPRQTFLVFFYVPSHNFKYDSEQNNNFIPAMILERTHRVKAGKA